MPAAPTADLAGTDPGVATRFTNLRMAAEKAASAAESRAERLRKGRAQAPPLREMSPRTAHVAVHLEFRSEEASSHADQSFMLYPGARAYFGFPCPCGDCDGIFDLAAAAQSVLQHSARQVSETLECAGTRSRQRMPRQPCGLKVSYTMTATKGALDV